MTRFSALALVSFALGLAGCDSCAPPSTEQEIQTLDATEKQALSALLKGTGVPETGLRSIGLLGIDRNPRAIAIEKGHIIGLRLTGVTVADLGPARQLPALQSLWLTGCTLPALGGLGGLGALRDLSLAGSGLTSLAGLANLPQLAEISLDDNKLRSLDPLGALPALRKVSARNNLITTPPSLGEKVTVVLDGNPVVRATAASSASPPAPAPGVLVTTLPETRGKTTGQGPHSVEGGLRNSKPLEATGVYDSLTGAFTLGVASVESVDPTVDVEISVATGRVRVYLEDQSRKGYRHAEATPGHPARLEGRMILGGSFFGVVVESLDGTATVLRYRVTQVVRK